ncbi:hypothetical protein [Clostridium beijerinckii]|uniref:hypothetical protein n=1 Tax=Clostridium beijerinckii TaxID=1520 RepID=UPI00242E4F46|nr:hypothetical protein [Clostridium beijerinckii]MDG5852444.1 hypothetical protein [Clostridium beijerinckii]
MVNYENELYKTLDEEIDKELNSKITRPIYLIVNDAIKVYNELIKNESHVFSGDYFEEIRGRLIGYAVKRAFDPKLITGNFPFNVTCAKMNFKQKRPELRKNNILLTISQVSDLSKLPTKSKYKEKYSEGNSLIAKQLMIREADELKVKDIPYYGIIRYKYAEGELEHLDIVIPDVKYRSIIKTISIPIISEMRRFDEGIQEDLEESTPLIKKEDLKEQLEKDIKDKKIK